MTKIGYLDGPRLRRGLLAACEYGQRSRGELNRINVFPVPDGDTGTNLALTLRSISDGLRRERAAAVGDVASRAAEAGILGARGNCGMILSHFLLGFADGIGDREEVSSQDFARALRAGVDHVYGALETPVEGTIITVMRASAEAAEEGQERDFYPLLQRILERTRQTLARTPELLPVLRKAGVVDAGAKGFVALLEGIAAYVNGDPILPPKEDFSPGPIVSGEVEYGDSERYRFCTEALVRGEGLPGSQAVRDALGRIGDSMVVISTGNLLKVHIHTDEPEVVFAWLREAGRLVTHKAEDMRAQHEAIGRASGDSGLARRPVVIVTDTACDLPDEQVRAHGIHLVPLQLVFEEGALKDRVEIDSDTFAERVVAGDHPSTSQPTPASFLRAYGEAAEEGEELVVVALGSRLSGTYASAEAAAQRFEGAPITLVDSGGASLMQGLLALRAAELAEAALPPAEIKERLEAIRARSGVMFTVDTFDRLIASGRVSRGRALLGSLLDIKPILEVGADGVVQPAGKVRGRANVLRKMVDLLAERVPADADKVRFGVVHMAYPEILEEASAAIRARYGEDAEVLTGPVTPVIATHTGPGAWGLAWMAE
ncbi:MAG: DegV family protein [Gemmatimonadota bacterium]